MRRLFYRGRHRATRFSIRVQDFVIADQLLRRDGFEFTPTKETV